MLASVRTLLTGLIDYAGLFPPAQLPLDQALRQYAAYRQGPDAWMLGRFIVPATRLAEVSATAGDWLAQGPSWSFAVLGRGGGSVAEFLEGLQTDLETIQGFCRRHAHRVGVEIFEVKLPTELLAAPQIEQCHQFYHDVFARIPTMMAEPLACYFEAGLTQDWRSTFPAVLPVGRGGLKLRCGGLEATAFPTVEQVAFAIATCRAAHVPFKATAGLHHPLRHTDAILNVKMHGFLNVFGGAVLAFHHPLAEEQLQALVEDENAAHFVFDEMGFRWQDFRVTPEQIGSARERFASSFGSCSFEEPCEDLRRLGLLD